MDTWSVDVVGVRDLLRLVDQDAVETDTEGEGLSSAVDEAVAELDGAGRVRAARLLTGFFDVRVQIPENLLAYISDASGALSAATATIDDGDATMALDARAAEMASFWNLDDAVSRIGGKG
ncbi:hypothetical protein [Microbacterium galbinum]|uniref:Uncharacterized protein n=1 Tax=Microbacterium galbinum TaxID=2851646 RepID=A0ABY4IVP3_9MICO|nr:hypothetical protein [Microbacterium galbinum]UPL15951.1 hypothetical protein KV396_16380 [Microbacterium galbinum]